MVLRIFIALILLFPISTNGQSKSDSTINYFYNQTLVAYFSDTINIRNQLEYSCILVQTDFDTSQLIKSFTSIKLSFFNSKTDKLSLLVRPIKSNKGRNIYWINHKTYGKDTIDINIGGWVIQSVSKNKIELAAWDGGTMGYIPTSRYIYNKNTKSWDMISEKEIIQNIIDKSNSH